MLAASMQSITHYKFKTEVRIQFLNAITTLRRIFDTHGMHKMKLCVFGAQHWNIQSIVMLRVHTRLEIIMLEYFQE